MANDVDALEQTGGRDRDVGAGRPTLFSDLITLKVPPERI